MVLESPAPARDFRMAAHGKPFIKEESHLLAQCKSARMESESPRSTQEDTWRTLATILLKQHEAPTLSSLSRGADECSPCSTNPPSSSSSVEGSNSSVPVLPEDALLVTLPSHLENIAGSAGVESIDCKTRQKNTSPSSMASNNKPPVYTKLSLREALQVQYRELQQADIPATDSRVRGMSSILIQNSEDDKPQLEEANITHLSNGDTIPSLYVSSARRPAQIRQYLQRAGSTANLRASVFQGLERIEGGLQLNRKGYTTSQQRSDAPERRPVKRNSMSQIELKRTCSNPPIGEESSSTVRRSTVVGILKGSQSVSRRENLRVSFSTWALFSDDIGKGTDHIRDAVPKQPFRRKNNTGEHTAALRQRNNAAATRIQAIARGGMTRLRHRVDVLQSQLVREQELQRESITEIQRKKWKGMESLRYLEDQKRRIVAFKEVEDRQTVDHLKKENATFQQNNSSIAEMMRLLQSSNEHMHDSCRTIISGKRMLAKTVELHLEKADRLKLQETKYNTEVAKHCSALDSMSAALESETLQIEKLGAVLEKMVEEITMRVSDEGLLAEIEALFASLSAITEQRMPPPTFRDVGFSVTQGFRINERQRSALSLVEEQDETEESDEGFDLTFPRMSNDDVSVVTESTQRRSSFLGGSDPSRRRSSVGSSTASRRRSSAGGSTFADIAPVMSVEISIPGSAARRSSTGGSNFADDGTQWNSNASGSFFGSSDPSRRRSSVGSSSASRRRSSAGGSTFADIASVMSVELSIPGSTARRSSTGGSTFADDGAQWNGNASGSIDETFADDLDEDHSLADRTIQTCGTFESYPSMVNSAAA